VTRAKVTAAATATAMSLFVKYSQLCQSRSSQQSTSSASCSQEPSSSSSSSQVIDDIWSCSPLDCLDSAPASSIADELVEHQSTASLRPTATSTCTTAHDATRATTSSGTPRGSGASCAAEQGFSAACALDSSQAVAMIEALTQQFLDCIEAGSVACLEGVRR